MPFVHVKISKHKRRKSRRFPRSLLIALKNWAIPRKKILIITAVFLAELFYILITFKVTPINKVITASSQGFIFENHNETFDVKFGVNNNGKPEHLMLFEKDGAKISFQYLNTGTDMKVAKSDFKTAKGENISLVKFSDIYKNTHVYYQITNTSIKEDIILTGKEAPQTFVIALTTDNVEYKTDASQNINFEKDGNKVFALAPMFMQDAQGEINHEIIMKIDLVRKGDQGENIYRLTIEPSQEWLNSATRKYPVTIDPSLVFFCTL